MSASPELARTHALQQQFTAHIRDPQTTPAITAVEDRRMAVYRDLIFSNMESFISSNFPVIRSLYDENAWDEFAHDFLREHLCHTPLFPEFGREFLRYVEFRQQQGRDDPPFLLELAHYEFAELALAIDENDIASVAHDPDGDPSADVPVVSPLVCVLAYRFPVHRINADFRPELPDENPSVLLLVRGRDDSVRFHEINALSALLIERLSGNTELTGAQCLEALLAEHGDASAPLREAGLAVLRELREHEAILGTRM
jgi:hypothetical protein